MAGELFPHRLVPRGLERIVEVGCLPAPHVRVSVARGLHVNEGPVGFPVDPASKPDTGFLVLGVDGLFWCSGFEQFARHRVVYDRVCRVLCPLKVSQCDRYFTACAVCFHVLACGLGAQALVLMNVQVQSHA